MVHMAITGPVDTRPTHPAIESRARLLASRHRRVRSVVRPEQLDAREGEARTFVGVITRPTIIVVTLGTAILPAAVIAIAAVGIVVGVSRAVAAINVAILARLLLGMPAPILILGLILSLLLVLILVLILIPAVAVALGPALSPFGAMPVSPVLQIGVARLGIGIFRRARLLCGCSLLFCRRRLLVLLCRLPCGRMIRRF